MSSTKTGQTQDTGETNTLDEEYMAEIEAKREQRALEADAAINEAYAEYEQEGAGI